MDRRQYKEYDQADVKKALDSNPESIDQLLLMLGSDSSVQARRRLKRYCDSIGIDLGGLMRQRQINCTVKQVEKILEENNKPTPNEVLILLGVEPTDRNRKNFMSWSRQHGFPQSSYTLTSGRRISDKDLEEAVASSSAYVEVSRKLGLSLNNGSRSYLSRRIKRLNINTSHFTTSPPPLGKNEPVNYPGLLVNDPSVSARTAGEKLKKALVQRGVKQKCTLCSLERWRENEIAFELDHINGDWKDNRIENLRLLCPNCHSQTFSWRGRTAASANKREDKIKISPELLTLGTPHSERIKSAVLRASVIAAGLTYECSTCKINSWEGKEITLELDHENGKHWDNRLENLRFLCRNCHSQTNSWRGKALNTNEGKATKKKKPKGTCITCGNPKLTEIEGQCGACNRINRKTTVDWPANEELIKMLLNSSMTRLAKELKVSDNAIKKRLLKEYHTMDQLREAIRLVKSRNELK